MNAGELIQGRYRLEQELGKGGMATVWKAHDLRLERPVALKFLMAPLSEDPAFLVRFFQEAQQVARVSHPNVVHVLDFGDSDGCPYLVMEYLPGGALNDVPTPMDPKRALTLIAAAAGGAGAAHEVELVHRDLKPGNIMLTEDGIPKIADFGIAVTQAQERLTATGTAIGSPHYVSPEQASGKPTGPSSDVYSLGIVLYELLTGRRPFEHENAMALAIAHVEETPEPPSTHNPSLTPAIDAAVMKCLDKDPEARFADGAEMAEALRRVAAGSDTAPFATVAATPLTAATATVAVADDDFDETPAVGNARRGLGLALLASLFLGLLIFGVMALAGDDGRNEEKATAEVRQGGSVNVNGSPTPEGSDGDEGVYEETATVESSPAPEETEDIAEETTEEQDQTTTTAEDEEDRDDKDEDWSEPSPEPTSEPTSEPAPTKEPAPEPTATP